jgi:hypothetical protein
LAGEIRQSQEVDCLTSEEVSYIKAGNPNRTQETADPSNCVPRP